MNLEELNKKIIQDFKKSNFRENFKDLIKIYKLKKDSDTANKIGVVLINLNKINYAEYFFKIAINLNNKNFKSYFNLANLYKSKDKKLSEEYIDIALKIEKKPDAIILKSHLLIGNYKYEEAIKILDGLDTCESFFLLGSSYLSLGNDEKGKYYLNESLKFNNLKIDFLNLNTFPRVYKNTKDIFYFRKRFKKIIINILNSIENKNISKQDRISILASKTNFNLSYQQKNDLELNKKYQELCQRILNNNNSEINFHKNKILFVSGFFYKHTVSKLFFNFVKELSLIKNLEVNLLHLSSKEDEWTEMYRKLNVKFFKNTNIQMIFNFLKEERYNSIFFLDHSMNNISQAIINYKLAKNYFIFFGHPVTTGSDNVDFFISSTLIDNKHENHFSEKLILLDSIGFNYKLDEQLKSTKVSNYEDYSLYIPQSLFKFLPKYDYLIGEILDQNKLSTISFINDKDPYYTQKFINRIKRIPQINKNFNRINFFDGMDQSTYYKTLSKQKIIIDTIGWSGGNTTMEALYLNKPIITLKKDNLRANVTAAILEKIKLNELVAVNYKEYLRIINKINNDKNFYNSIIKKIEDNKELIFNKKISLYEKIKKFI